MKNIKDYEAMARLDLPESERRWVSDRADMLINSFNLLDGIDASNVEPLITVLDIQNVFRDDVSIKMLPREEILANAPEQYEGYFQVPRALD